MKRCLLTALGSLLLTPSVSAIIDTNNNGLSDLWERAYNADEELFDDSFAPEADADSDGWTNAEEAAAGTDPFDPTPPDGMVRPETAHIPAAPGEPDENGIPGPDTPEAVTVTWPTLVGKQYTLWFSPDLAAESWIPVGDSFPGNGNDFTYTFENNDTDSRFWRVEVKDTDTDGDELTDWEEHKVGTDPNSVDTDQDGMEDKAELEWTAPDGSHPLQPLDPDYDKDGIKDGVELAANPATSPIDNNNDTDPDGHRMDSSIYPGMVGWWGFQDTPTSSLFVNRAGLAAHSLALTGGAPSGFCIAGTGITNNPTTATRADLRVLTSGSLLLDKHYLSLNYWIQLPLDGLAAAAPGLPAGPGATLMAYSNNGDALPVLEWRATRVNGQTRFSLAQIMGTPSNIVIPGDWDSTVKLDDAQWHHLALTVGSNSTRMFLDGVQVGTGAINYSLTIPPNAWQYNPYLLVGGYKRSSGATLVTYSDLKGRLDSIMVHNQVLQLSHVQAIYNRDRDSDTLPDIVEVKSLLWRDAAPYGTATTNEYSFASSPNIWQDSATDTDGDGLSTTIEIATTHTDPFRADTDGDLIPDGWETANGLDPNNPADATLDNDSGGGDGLTNLDEFRNNTNPRLRDSDGDLVSDGDEVKGPDGIVQIPIDPSTGAVPVDDGSDPNDLSDHGQPLPADEIATFRLGVGDRSVSRSEDYVLNVFRYTRASGLETRVYSVRANGFGKYAEIVKSFRKGVTYTFQIQWLGTNNDVKTTTIGGTTIYEGPDWDYHLVVKEVSAIGKGLVLDSFNPASRTIGAPPQLLDSGDPLPADDNDDNVTDFPSTLQTRRLLFTPVALERDEDAPDGNWLPFAGPLAKALPGQKLNLRLRTLALPSQTPLSNFEWVLPETAFKDYVPDQNQGVLTRLQATDLNRSDVGFYLAGSGLKTVTAKCKVNGIPAELSCGLMVDAPISTFTTRHGSVRFSNFSVYLAVGFYADPAVPDMTGGIDFIGRVDVPAGWPQGEWSFVQLCTANRTRTALDNSPITHSLNGVEVLDTSYPYGLSDHETGIYPTGTGQISGDSPEAPLAGFATVNANDTLVIYQMFRPSGSQSRYVPLKKLTWGWHGAAVRDEDNTWSIPPDSTGSYADESTSTTDHPVWTDNWKNGTYSNQ